MLFRGIQVEPVHSEDYGILSAHLPKSTLDTRILTAILSKDSKDTTYKYALLRAMVQCVMEQSPHKKVRADGWVSYPFGLLIYFWLLYYYPIFASKIFIPQKNGETPELRQGQTIAFRREFNAVIDFYRQRGDLPFFRYQLIHDKVPNEISDAVLTLIRKLQQTIKNMPMKHLGFYEFGEHYSLVRYDTSTIRQPSYYDLIKNGGVFYIEPGLHLIMDDVGALIIGQDSIIDGWAEFTAKASERMEGAKPVPKEKVLTILTRAVDIKRDVVKVRKVLHGMKHREMECIWSGTRLKSDFDIDHAIPYSLWQNNNLWNLVPVSSSINSRKSDKIPSPALIENSSDRIKNVWGVYQKSYGEQFERELFEGLGTGLDNGMNDAIHALIRKSEYLIEKRGFQKFEL